MEDFNKRRKIKVAPTISYVSYPSYPNIDTLGPKEIPSLSNLKNYEDDVRDEIEDEARDRELIAPVSYTHLTLPTICSV